MLQGLFGNATEVDAKDLKNDLVAILVGGE
jgi:hypothetical protein